MNQKHYLITLLFLFNYFLSFSQVLSGEERKLYNNIMEYRRANGLPTIPLSASLTYVAQMHCKDFSRQLRSKTLTKHQDKNFLMKISKSV